MTNRERILKMTVEEYLSLYADDALEQMMYDTACDEKRCPVYQRCGNCCAIDEWLDEECEQ